MESRAIDRRVPRAHDWDMISAFALTVTRQLPEEGPAVLAPICAALAPYGLPEALLEKISAEIEQLGEDLRKTCPEGKLDCVNVRIHMTARPPKTPVQQWDYFTIKQIVSSESDNLGGFDNPCCYIDLYVQPA